MPDLLLLLQQRWKMIATVTITATLLAVVGSLLRPKEYLGVVTALPANSATTDKARLLNPNIEGLYPELGSPDELDRIDGIVQLDTLYLAVAAENNLPAHYEVEKEQNALDKAARILRKQTDIRRSAYGELKIKVWDKEAVVAADLANRLLQKLNELYGALIQANNSAVLATLQKGLSEKERQLDSLDNQSLAVRNSAIDTLASSQIITRENNSSRRLIGNSAFFHRHKALQESIAKQSMLIEEYSLALSLRPQLLLPVETARPSVSPDRPRALPLVLFVFGAALLFSILFALVLQNRRAVA